MVANSVSNFGSKSALEVFQIAAVYYN